MIRSRSGRYAGRRVQAREYSEGVCQGDILLGERTNLEYGSQM